MMNEEFEKILDMLEATRYIAQDDSVAELIRTRIWNKALHKAKQIVKKVAEEYKGGWIHCSERLPEDDSNCMKTHGNAQMMFAHIFKKDMECDFYYVSQKSCRYGILE